MHRSFKCNTSCAENDVLLITTVATQERTNEMEDCSDTVVLDNTGCFTAVYDGHAGDNCAKYLQQKLYHEIKSLSNEQIPSDAIITDVFLDVDAKFYESKDWNQRYDPPGSTANVIFIKSNHERVDILCASVGDSRAVMFDGETTIPLSNDHRPTNETERSRIESYGGYICDRGKLQGFLSNSRAFGDFQAKDKGLTAEPEIIRYSLTRRFPSFVILASDGLWDEFPESSDIVRIVKNHLVHYHLFDGEPVRENLTKPIIDAACYKSIQNWSISDCKEWVRFGGLNKELHVFCKIFSDDGDEMTSMWGKSIQDQMCGTELINLCEDIERLKQTVENATYSEEEISDELVAQFVTVFSDYRKRHEKRLSLIPTTASEKLQVICERVVDYAVKKRENSGKHDNITVTIILFKG
jgi:serine/threonine protein phosphatase PrpC